MNKTQYTIYRPITGFSHNLPIHLDENIQQLGMMSSFDGDISHVEQISSFTYSGNGMSVRIFNTNNTNILPELIHSVFTINWGDNTPFSTLSFPDVNGSTIPSVSHTYTTSGEHTIRVTIESPWEVKKIKKIVKVPFTQSYGFPTSLGSVSFSTPHSYPKTETDYRAMTGTTNPARINFVGIGQSRLDEFRKYGTNQTYLPLSFGNDTDGTAYTGYTIDDLFYMDRVDGYTHITGTTTGTTISFYTDEVYNGMVTRNEHFLGFIDEPTIYSDVFVDRGKMGVMEKNLRLTDIDGTGELDIYGNGYFNVRKQ